MRTELAEPQADDEPERARRTVTIRGRKLELPPNCPFIQEGTETFCENVSHVQRLKGHLYFTLGPRTFCDIEAVWKHPPWELLLACVCESYWRREAERLMDCCKNAMSESQENLYAEQMNAAYDHAEAWAALHRELLQP